MRVVASCMVLREVEMQPLEFRPRLDLNLNLNLTCSTTNWYYVLCCFRRMWRVFSKLAPSLNLSPYTDPLATDYPFSVPVDQKVSFEDVMELVRDHYQGTEFDNTKVRERL